MTINILQNDQENKTELEGINKDNAEYTQGGRKCRNDVKNLSTNLTTDTKGPTIFTLTGEGIQKLDK